MANNSSELVFSDDNSTDLLHNLTTIAITVYSVPPLSLQVFLLCSGIIMNLSIVLISLRRKFIQGSFKVFILNLALLDLFVSVCLVFYLLISYAPDFLGVSGEVFSACAMYVFFAIIMGTLPLSFSRHIAISHPLKYDSMFPNSKCIVYCAILDFLPVLSIAAIFLNNQGSILWRAGWLIYLISIPVGFVLILYFCLHVYKGIKRKVTNSTSMEERVRMKEAKEVALVSIIQAIKAAPVCAPLVIYFLVAAIYYNAHPNASMTDSTMITLWDICYTIFNTLLFGQPFFDALVTLSLIRQYRNVTNKFLAKLHKFFKRKRRGTVGASGEFFTNARSDSRIRAVTAVG